ncbi:MAG: hypothetical protein QF918_10730 [Pirellulaceae bacterium]|jgi:hypothetical protein|nr:hypothetical protein [Pirellulaceae bacterium]MDP6553297.1 hypothetical protein [Pirellulaceae bacterium]MDP6722602.1 hypothetical protein [Pirellulaceae bacterium]
MTRRPATQLQIEFDSAGVYKAIANADFSSLDLRQTSVATCKTVLRDLQSMIGSKEGFRVRHEKIGDRLGLAQSTVKRAVRAMRRAGILATTRTGRSSLYCIQIERLDELRAPSDSARCPIRKRTVPHQIAHGAPSTLPPLSKSTYSPPYGDDWSRVEGELLDFEYKGETLADVAGTLAAARANGLSPEYVAELLRYVQSERPTEPHKARLVAPQKIAVHRH